MGCCCSAPDPGGGHKGHKAGWNNGGSGDKYKKHMTSKQARVFKEIETFGPLKKLKRLFDSADCDGSGSIDTKELLGLLQLTPNAYTRRLIELLDSDADGQVSLAEFVIGMARFNSRRVIDKKAFAFALFDTDGGGTVDTHEMSKLVMQCFNDKLRQQRASQWGDGGKDPMVVTMHNFLAKLKKDYPPTLDFDEFGRMINTYLRLFQPAFTIWAALEPFSGPAAKVAEKLAAAGHREFDVRANNFAAAVVRRRATDGLDRGSASHSDSSNDDDDGGGGGGGGEDGENILGRALFESEYDRVMEGRRRRKVRPHKEKSVSDEMMEKARAHREKQLGVTRLNRFAANAGTKLPYKESSFIAKARSAWNDMTNLSKRGGMSLAGVRSSMKRGLALMSNGLGLGGGGGGGGGTNSGGHIGKPVRSGGGGGAAALRRR